jgi:hypothetical protein
MRLALRPPSYADSHGSSPPRSRAASTISEEYEGDVNYSDSGVDSDGDSLDDSSVFTYSSVDSGTSRRQYMWRKIQYSWRRRLRLQKRSSTSRHKHKVASKVLGRKGIASSLPDLGLYKTWDSRTALKVRARVLFSSLLVRQEVLTPRALVIDKEYRR